MSSYENCPPDVELVSVATLDSIFEMEQFVVRLNNEKIPWRVIEHDETLLPDLSGHLGHATLYTTKEEAEKVVELLKKHRLEQTEGKECPNCGLWLGPSVEVCPACKYNLNTQAVGIEYSDEDDEEYEEEDGPVSEYIPDRVRDLENAVDILIERQEKMEQMLEDIKLRLDELSNK